MKQTNHKKEKRQKTVRPTSTLSKFKPANLSRARMLIFVMMIAIVGIVGLTVSRAASQHKVRFVLFCAEGCGSFSEGTVNNYATQIQGWYRDQTGKTFELLPTKTYHGSRTRAAYNDDLGYTSVGGATVVNSSGQNVCGSGGDDSTRTYCNVGNEAALLETDVKVVVMLAFRSLANCGIGGGPLAIGDPSKGCTSQEDAVLAHELGHTLLSSSDSDHTSDHTLMNAPAACNGNTLSNCSLNASHKTRIQASDWFNRTTNPAPEGDFYTSDGDTEPYACAYQSGWAVDRSDVNAKIQVHVYVDGALESSALIANRYLGDDPTFRNTFGTSDDHGWVWDVPARLKDGRTHYVDFYVIDHPTGNEGNNRIRNVSRSINCAAPVGEFKLSSVLPKCVGNKSKVELSWTGGNNAAGWNIDLDDDTNPGWWYRDVGDGNVRTFIVPDDQLNQHDNPNPPERITLTGGRQYRARIFSDAGGNATEWVAFTAVSNCDTTAPTAPSGLRSNGSASNTSIPLAWNANAAADEVSSYELTISGGTSRVTDVGNVTSYNVTGLAANTSYTFTLKAKDNASPKNTSASSSPFTTSTAGGEAVTYKPIKGVSSSRCIDVANGSTANHAKIQLYDCNIGDYQQWALFSDKTIRAKHSGKCLDVIAAGVLNGTDVQQYDCIIGATNQQWVVNTSDLSICSVASNRCLDAEGPSDANNTQIQIWDFTGAGNQKWNFGADTTPPAAPTGLNSTGNTQTSIALSWTANPAADGVASYELTISGGTSRVTNVGNVTSYNATGLTAGTSYTFVLKAKDAAGNTSPGSASITRSTASAADTTAPTKPAKPVIGTVTHNSVALSWSANPAGDGVTKYRVYRGGVMVADVTGTSYTNTGLSASTNYSYTITAFDAANNQSVASDASSATTTASPDTQAPTKPGKPVITSTSTSQICFNWTASTDDKGVAGYKIFRNNAQISTTAGLTYCDSGLPGSTTYNYTVQAYDAASNVSPVSDSTPGTTQTPSDSVAPSVPANLRSTGQTTTTRNLAWDASTDNVGVKDYLVYQNGAVIATVTSTSHSISGLSAGQAYNFVVRARDAALNVSNSSNTLSVTQPAAGGDTQPPTTPGSFAITSVRGECINYTFKLSSDNVSVEGYRLYHRATGASIYSVTGLAGNSFWGSAGTTVSTMTCSSEFVGKTVEMYMTARDAASNESAPTQIASVQVSASDSTPPTKPSNLQVTYRQTNRIDFKWDPSTDAGSGLKHYQVWRDNAYLGSTTATSFSDGDLSQNTTYRYYVVAYDYAGNTTGSAPLDAKTCLLNDLTCGIVK